jgi:ABC-2 type transport system ATP-binding protein
MLLFRNFEKSYGSHLVLNIPDLTLPAGIHWLKGKNGSGKTTLFKSLAGLLPYQGNLILDQNLVLKQYPVLHRQYISFGEAEPVYPDFLTGIELINLFKSARKAPAGQPEALIEYFGTDYLTNPVGTYSSGMQKKLSLILAFIGQPKLILLDEPLITLDTATVELVFALMLDYRQKHQTSFLVSSHQNIQLPELPLTATWQVQKKTLTQLFD